MKSLRAVSATFFLTIFFWASFANAKAFVVRPWSHDSTSLKILNARYERWIKSPFRDRPSRRNLVVPVRGDHWGLLKEEPKRIKVCGIRVEFASVPDPGKISGNGGRFDLSDRRDEIPIDPPPHDRKYFKKHLEALSLYFEAMSYGRIKLEGEIFPLINDSAYVLPDVGVYNPGGGVWTWELEGLEQFFKDAIRVADEDRDFQFKDYDVVIIFHAGSDWQNDIRGDSPYDIPSYFISLVDSIAVDDSTHFIVDGSVVPETTSQDGYFNGLNGVIAHEFGHQLGLPDLYDALRGISVVGYWDLMDYGSGTGVTVADTTTGKEYYVTGIIPGSLSAWSRAKLGWIEPDTVLNDSCVLQAIGLQNADPTKRSVLVQISPREYFLIENRQADLDGDGSCWALADTEDSTFVIVAPADSLGRLNYEYDFLLPGSGLLVWHVDEQWLRWLIPYDLVNAFPQRRGVTLVEADGIPDLVDPRSIYYLGSPYDPFYLGNNNRLGDDTYPSSRSQTGCHTGIEIRDIGYSGLEMSFKVIHRLAVEGFPISIGDSLRFGFSSLAIADIGGDGGKEIVAALKRGEWDDSLTVWHQAEIHMVAGSRSSSPKGVVWSRRLAGEHPTEICLLDWDGEEDLEIVVADEKDRLYGFKADGTFIFDQSDSLGGIDIGAKINGPPVAATVDSDTLDEILIGTDSGLLVLDKEKGRLSLVNSKVSHPVKIESADKEHLVAYSPGSVLVWALPLGDDLPMPREIEVSTDNPPCDVYLVSGDFYRNGKSVQLVLATKDGWVSMVDILDGETNGWRRHYCDSIVAPPSVADINGDGYLDVLITSSEQKTWAILKSGALADGWPRSIKGCGLPLWDEGFFPPDVTIPIVPPLIGDIDGDGSLEVVQGSRLECILAWKGDGTRLDGFPMALGAGCAAISIFDASEEGGIRIALGGGDGYIYSFHYPGSHIDEKRQLPWPTSYGSMTRNAFYPPQLMPEPVEPGDTLLVKGSFYVYPNPAKDKINVVYKTQTGGDITIEIFDIMGRRLSLFTGSVSPEKRSEPFSISNFGNGLYLCRLTIRNNGSVASDVFQFAVKR
ncbi:MAG: T9SS type A sorting domain-containing protein [bacterium]